jgi:hypothetical protein
MFMTEREKLTQTIADPAVIRYFYLDQDVVDVMRIMDGLQLTISESQDEVPFNAQVKGYVSATDSTGDPWIIKAVASDDEMVFHRSCLIAYLLDHETGTLAAPTTAVLIGGKRYRATKVVKKGLQISSYNYLEVPFINLLRADLINRWVYFDEDRNPNNYLVITNARNEPFLVAIDYDKADLMSSTMKITGTKPRFGWLRAEKTRFLTLLRPDHFEGLSIEIFDDRLKAFRALTKERLLTLTTGAFGSFGKQPGVLAEQVANNLDERIRYVDEYFRSMFGAASDATTSNPDSDYSAFGASFMAMHGRRK